MSDDWQVGDLALCVDAGLLPWVEPGCIYTVADLNTDWLEIDGLGLELAGVDAGCGYTGFVATSFRKILPDKHEDCEPEFVTLLNRIKRKVGA